MAEKLLWFYDEDLGEESEKEYTQVLVRWWWGEGARELKQVKLLRFEINDQTET